MSYSVYTTPTFKRLFKRLYKKHPSLKADIQKLIALLGNKPVNGIPLGYGVYKIRVAISSKTKGKSGGARVITYVITENKEVYLIHIYDKGQLDNISREQIMDMLRKANLL